MKYPIGVQSFETLRSRGFVYLDKTALIYDLVQGHVFFLCRPRRFGKSLLVSTLKAYFEGRRDLFDGLAISRLEQDWERYPVFHLDFNGSRYVEGGMLHNLLEGHIARWEEQYGLTPRFASLGQRFVEVLAEAHRVTGKSCVVLVDEYDKPMLDVLGSQAITTLNGQPISVEEDNRQELKAFYSCFKAADQDLRFVLLTGVTKFSQVSVFSGFNQPNDITFDSRYQTLCGITEQELHTVFEEPIRQLADRWGWTIEQTKAFLKKRYDGYHFSVDMIDVYNPFSILNALDNGIMRDYWFSTGTPEYLLRLLASSQQTMLDYVGHYYSPEEFIDYRADIEQPLPMIFQSGYLTIKGVTMKGSNLRYLIDYPNDEVKQGFVTMLASNFFQTRTESTMTSWVEQLTDAFATADLDQVQRLFTAFLADTPYQMRPKKQTELYFHYTFYLIMRLVSCYTVFTEHQNSQGRCDCTVETPEHIYIFEFKLDGSADEALEQIRQRGYAQPYAADPRQLHLIGATFSSETGTIGEWKNSNPNPNPNDNPNPKGNNI